MNTNDKHLTCADAKDQFSDWLTGELPDADRAAFDAHVAACPGCRQALVATQQVWQRMGEVPTPEPRPQLRTQFYAMLDTFEVAETTPKRSWTNSLIESFQQNWKRELMSRLAYSLVLLGVGMAAGFWLQQPQKQDVAYQQRIDTLSVQVQAMRQMMMLSLLENPSATERLRAVGFTKDISDADSQVIDALLMTLNNDPNVNVRLVTLEALADLAQDARVREGLVQSLTRQESPSVQVALADVMVKLQEKRSVKPLRQLLRQPGTNDLVRSKLEQTIRELS
ncbi:MAG: HEAT repeat domain-containing protein [Bacteroidetes bacterium]|nr:HEAT repeat domain-containing protein [Fibrella sp.]